MSGRLQGCLTTASRVEWLEETEKQSLLSDSNTWYSPPCRNFGLCGGLQAGSSMKPQIPSESKCPRRFGEIGPEILRTCLMCPCRAFHEWVFSFFFFFPPGIWVFVFWGDIWVLRDPRFPSKKNKKTKRKLFVKGSAGAH